MNEYQQRQREKADEFGRELRAIAIKLPTNDISCWQLAPFKDGDDWAPVWRCLRRTDGKRELWAQKSHTNGKARFEFMACGWPSYTDETGSKQHKRPSDCYQPRETTPKTTAAVDREPKAIAKQIVTRLLPDYDRIYTRLEHLAKETQKYHDKTADARQRLAKAAGDEYKPDASWRGVYIKDLPGNTVRIDFNSIGDCRLSLHANEMVEVIGLLRQLRDGKA